MALDVIPPGPIQGKPHPKGRRQCSCCPYGYHIDLDFVRYCESITTAQLMPLVSTRKNRWNNIRRKRASREALLGLEEQQPVPVYAEPPSVDSNDIMGDGWHKAVLDFEKTLKHASLPRTNSKKDWNGFERERNSQTENNVSPGHFNSSHTLPRNRTKSAKDGVDFVLPIEEMLFVHANSNNASAETLQNIREQMAASLRRMRELEDQIKVIPSLNDHIGKLKIENEKLRNELKHKEDIKEVVPSNVSSDKTTSTHDLVHCRAAAVGCVVLTREVGTSPNTTMSKTIGVGPDIKPESSPSEGEPVSLHKIIGIPVSFRYKNVSVMTDQIEPPKTTVKEEQQDKSCSTDLKMSDLITQAELDSRILKINQKNTPPPKVSIRVNTHLHHDQLFTQNELDEKVAKFAKTYENNFLSTNLAMKAKMVHCSIQTSDKPGKKHLKDAGIQVLANVSHVGIIAKPKMATAAHQTFKFSRDIGVSDDTTLPLSCDRCKTKKSSIGTLFPEQSERLLQRINSKEEMTVAKRKTLSRSTDTNDLLATRDVSMNTPKKKLVSTYVETGEYTCKLCPQQPPRPSMVRVPAKRPSYLPISVSRVKTPTTPSPKTPLQHEGSNSDSGSDDGTYTIHQDFGELVKGDDRSPMSRSYIRREPSKEMRGAMKVLNDALLKSPGGDIPKHVKTAVNIVQQEWFKVSSVASANPLDVEYYLDCFEEISATLLEYVVNMSDVSGNTAMHYAVSNGNFDVVSILLDSKVCNINKLNTAGYTSIMLVALTKVKSETDREVVRRLFHMADVNIRAKQHGQTALMLAVSHGRIDTVELLLEAGADINIQDDDGSTALMCAAEHGYIEIVKLLLAQPDCDLSITDYDGTSALAIAMEAGNRDVGVLLYAQEHFSRGSSPYTSLKHKRSKSTTPTLKTSRPTTPSHSSAKKDHEVDP